MRKLELKPLLIIAAAVLATALVAVALFRQAAQNSLWEQSRSQAETVAGLIAARIDPQQHLRLWQTRDPALYQTLLTPLVHAHQHLPEVYYLYTLIHDDEGDRFVLDTATVPELVSHGRDLEASDLGELAVDEEPEQDVLMREAMARGETFSYQQPYTDDYGTFMIAHAPIGHHGEGGFIGIDYDISSIFARLAEIDRFAVLAAVAATALSLLIGLVGMTMIRREQSRREEVEESARAQARLYAIISHDIRTPLNGIMGSLELIDQQALSEEDQRHLKTIAACSDTMLGLFNDILDFHKFEHQQMPINRQPVNIRQVIEESVKWTASRSDLESPQFNVSIADHVAQVIMIDPLRLRQLLINILSNAARYGGGHPVELAVTMPQAELLISIRDRGVGMAEDQIEHLFEPFVRGGTETHSHHTGAGLGLAIVKTIVDAMGARIDVKSQLGTGTEFRLAIPAIADDFDLTELGSSGPQSDDTTSIQIVPLAAEPFLVVDDLHLNRVLLCDMLQRLGFAAREAASGEEAMELLSRMRFACILLDVNLPGMSGIEVIQEIRSNRSHRRCTVVTVTGDQFPETTQRCLDAGADYCLTKPLRLVDLKRVVYDFLELSRDQESMEHDTTANVPAQGG